LAGGRHDSAVTLPSLSWHVDLGPKAGHSGLNLLSMVERATGRQRPETSSAQLAVTAALALIRARHGASDVRSKGGLDLVTGTDIAAQAAIRSVLTERHPEYRFMGEEGERPDLSATDDRYWLVDPVCGTRNFASRVPLYCTNVALVEGGEVVLAVVGNGADGSLLFAERGRGAFVVRANTNEQLHCSDDSSTILLEPIGPSHSGGDGAAEAIRNAVQRARWFVRTLGTTLGLAYLASGAVAGVRYFSALREKADPVHLAAGALLAKESGALVTDGQGNPWRPFTSRGLVGAATALLHKELLTLAD
jgi:myo-inositol-1(or 4)-monophosphatase